MCQTTGTPARRAATPPYSAAFRELVWTRSGASSRRRRRRASVSRPIAATRATPAEPRRTSSRRVVPTRRSSSRTSTATPASRSRSSSGPCSPRITWTSTPSSLSAGSESEEGDLPSGELGAVIDDHDADPAVTSVSPRQLGVEGRRPLGPRRHRLWIVGVRRRTPARPSTASTNARRWHIAPATRPSRNPATGVATTGRPTARHS